MIALFIDKQYSYKTSHDSYNISKAGNVFDRQLKSFSAVYIFKNKGEYKFRLRFLK